MTEDLWYCTHPGERESAPYGQLLPEPDRCSHEECRPPGPQLVLDATPADEQQRCYCGGPDEIYGHVYGTGRACRRAAELRGGDTP